MLIPVPFDTIITDNDVNTSIDPRSIKGDDSNISQSQIEDIITSFVNIQVSLADIFPYQSIADLGSILSTCGIHEGFNGDQQLTILRKIFMEIHVIKENNIPIAFQVSNPFKLVLECFENLRNQELLNRWVQYFMLDEPSQDCSQAACYKFMEDNKGHDPVVLNFEQEDFFQYMFQNKRNNEILKNIPVSGFKLSEIEKDPYIREISKIVNNLYVFTSLDTALDEDDTRFLKFLTWDSLKKAENTKKSS